MSSLSIIYDLVQQRVTAQYERINSLDTKAGFVLGSATLLTGGISALQQVAITTMTDLNSKDPSTVAQWKIGIGGASLLAVLFYLVLVFASIQAYKIRKYNALSRVRTLIDKYYENEEVDTKEVLVDTLATLVEENDQIIDRKALWTQRAISCLMIEAILLAILTMLQLALGLQP
ncbi:MAG TPA: hypothetical protein VF952_08330 [Chloroflexia bacterium]